MAAYLILDVEVTDPAGYADYAKLAAPTVARYGGRYIVRGGKAETLEGDWQPKRVVVLEFESVEQLRRWYDSEEYRAPRALRHKYAKTNSIIVQGA